MSEPFQDTAFVIDSGSLLAYLRDDAGGALVQRVFRQCVDCEAAVEIASVDLLEAYSAAASEAPASLEELVSLVDQLPIRVEPADRDSVIAAAQLLVEHPDLKPSQAAALLLARERGATLVTADLTMARLSPSLYVGSPVKEGDLAHTQEFQGNSPHARR